MRTIALAILFLAAMHVASAQLLGTGGEVELSLLYYQPVPALPGDQLDVWIQLENNGGDATESGTVTVLDSGPFIVQSEKDRTRRVPPIPSQETFLFKTKVRVSKDANEGENSLVVRVQKDKSNAKIEAHLPITITGTNSALSIISAKTTPEEILPGQSASIDVTVKNVGGTTVRNVDVALNLRDLSFAPKGSSDSKTIGTLGGGNSHTFRFELVSYPDALAQAYRLPITLTYDDEQGNEKEQNETVGIVVGAKPELLVYFERIDLTKKEKEGEVVIKFVNKGLAEIKLLEVDILPAQGVEVTGESSVIYVGNIDEDDYESAELTLKVTEENVIVPLRVVYKDALNREYTEQIELPLKLQSEKNGNGTSKLVWIVVIVAAGAGLWWWTRRRKRRK